MPDKQQQEEVMDKYAEIWTEAFFQRLAERGYGHLREEAPQQTLKAAQVLTTLQKDAQDQIRPKVQKRSVQAVTQVAQMDLEDQQGEE